MLAFSCWFLFCIGSTSCTTLVNRRDLYSPEPAPDSLEAARQWYCVTTISTTTTIRTQRAAERSRPRTFVTRDQTESSDYGCCRAGITHAKDSQAEKPARRIRQGCLSYVLTERKIRLYPRHICVVDARCFGQPAFALCALRRQQMASRGTRPQDLSAGSDLQAFRHCFAGFAACNALRHTAENLIRAGAMTNALLRWSVPAPNAFGVHRMEPLVARRASSLARTSQRSYNSQDAISRTETAAGYHCRCGLWRA